MAGAADAQPFGSVVFLRRVRRLYRRRLTARGRFLLIAAAAVGFVGVDTRRTLGFALFALLAPPLVVALATLVRRRPDLRLLGRLPARLTAGRRLSLRLEIQGAEGGGKAPLSLFWAAPLPAESLAVSPEEATIERDEGAVARVALDFDPLRRGRFELPRLGVAATDAFGLCRTPAHWLAGGAVLVYPPYFTFDELQLPTGRRYQPGGIPLASEVGDSLEFVGTREYRDGDAPRKIHWRSWARLGRPVVKEYQEEYFSRLALVLDTFLPKRPGARERERFEAAVSMLASLANHFGRSEEVVDIFAAGPDLYEVSAGRSLGSLDSVLDVLSCLEPSSAPPFESVAPVLRERIAAVTTVVAVMLDWDEAREAFLREMRGMGVALRVFLVHEGETRRPWAGVTPDFAEIAHWTPAQVRARIVAESSA